MQDQKRLRLKPTTAEIWLPSLGHVIDQEGHRFGNKNQSGYFIEKIK